MSYALGDDGFFKGTPTLLELVTVPNIPRLINKATPLNVRLSVKI
jgi:hypothetical protein